MASATRTADALINYALDDKPNQKGERYVMASGVGGLLVSVAKAQMRDVRKKWGKDKPGAFVQAYHVIQSFGKDELVPDSPDSWMRAQQLGRALAEDRFPGRQTLVVTQRDGKSGCLHNHIVANSIETKTGKSLNSSIVMHSRLVEAHERVLEAEGFEQRADLKQAFSDATERRERGEPSGLRRAGSTEESELREFQRHILWETDCDIADEFGVEHNPEPFSLTVLESSIRQALADETSTDWASFVEAGRVHGVRIEQRGKKGRGISYGMLRKQPDGTVAEPSPSDRRRCATLGTEYEMDAVEQALARNSTALKAQALVAPVVAPVSQLIPPAPQTKPMQQKPSMVERMRAALDEVQAQADVETERKIAKYLREKEAAKEFDSRLAVSRDEAASQVDSAPLPPTTPPFSVSLADLRKRQDEAQEVLVSADEPKNDASDHTEEQHADSVDGSMAMEPELEAQVVESQEPERVAPEASSAFEAVEADPEPQATPSAAEEWRKINQRNRRLGLPLVSPAQHVANRAMTPEQRAWKLEHPELFDDDAGISQPGKQDRSLGD